MNTLTLRSLTALEGEEIPKYRLSFLLDAEDFEVLHRTHPNHSSQTKWIFS